MAVCCRFWDLHSRLLVLSILAPIGVVPEMPCLRSSILPSRAARCSSKAMSSGRHCMALSTLLI
eukprot:12267181-Heterocapsa_arctica.AAC.1